MKNFLPKLFVVFWFLHGTTSSFSQTANNAVANNSVYANNQKIEEVYGSHFFDNKQDLLRHFHRLLNHRIEYKILPFRSDEKYTKLSQVPLMNKHGELILDRNFNPNTFNPLRHDLNFFSKQTQIYRIDDSDYILIIKPQ
ncbi:hypothetical protein [Aureispira sp. CCB-QB1]|uniref:hypothetical protein n=1 Tax=Aureispira sp. CCB-QB1 TaxID=1313421 RepID=UPI000695E415|nr:hypothetical protein [Aureispira sp. CCB-QB1]